MYLAWEIKSIRQAKEAIIALHGGIGPYRDKRWKIGGGYG